MEAQPQRSPAEEAADRITRTVAAWTVSDSTHVDPPTSREACLTQVRAPIPAAAVSRLTASVVKTLAERCGASVQERSCRQNAVDFLYGIEELWYVGRQPRGREGNCASGSVARSPPVGEGGGANRSEAQSPETQRQDPEQQQSQQQQTEQKYPLPPQGAQEQSGSHQASAQPPPPRGGARAKGRGPGRRGILHSPPRPQLAWQRGQGPSSHQPPSTQQQQGLPQNQPSPQQQGLGTQSQHAHVQLQQRAGLGGVQAGLGGGASRVRQLPVAEVSVRSTRRLRF